MDVSANPSERTIQAKLPDEQGVPGIEITLHLDQTVHQNAQFYFAKGRKDKQRAEGAKAALEETQKRQKKVERNREPRMRLRDASLWPNETKNSGSKGIAGR